MAPVTSINTRRRTSLPAAAAFGLAFGWVEAAVVVYLRRLYYPEGFRFPLNFLPADIAAVEITRELATLVMLGAAACLGARSRWGRFGLFAFLFGVWDLAYYGGLFAAISWPSSPGEWDVLFLVPGIWSGPVWTAALIALLLVVCGAVIYVRGESSRLENPRARHWLMAAAAFTAILSGFLANHGLVIGGGAPRHFPTLLFLSGVVVGIVAFLDVLRSSRGMS